MFFVKNCYIASDANHLNIQRSERSEDVVPNWSGVLFYSFHTIPEAKKIVNPAPEYRTVDNHRLNEWNGAGSRPHLGKKCGQIEYVLCSIGS